MRTTLDIEDDALQAAKENARAERTTVGKYISKIIRVQIKGGEVTKNKKKYIYRNGVPVIPPRPGAIITAEHVQKLIDEEGI